MNDLTIIGTITIDRLHFCNQIKESFGGIPWFAIELNLNKKLKMSIVTNVGKDFSVNKIPKHILKVSKINVVRENTTTLDIFADQDGTPAIVKNFTGTIKNINSLKGKVAIISPFFQEISLESINKIRKKFNTLIIDIQGFTRPIYKQNIKLSDYIKTEPKVLSQLCKIADIIKFSENEMKVIKPKLSLREKFIALHNLGLKNIILTRADKGCMISKAGLPPKTFSVKAINVLNNIGVGDKFLTLLGFFLTKNNSFEESVRKAQNKLQILIRKQI
jgi:hypothetical protein